MNPSALYLLRFHHDRNNRSVRRSWLFLMRRWRRSHEFAIDLLSHEVNAEGSNTDPETRERVSHLVRKHRVLPPLIPSPEKLSRSSQRFRHLHTYINFNSHLISFNPPNHILYSKCHQRELQAKPQLPLRHLHPHQRLQLSQMLERKPPPARESHARRRDARRLTLHTSTRFSSKSTQILVFPTAPCLS